MAHLSPYCGSWYPDDPAELSDLLARLFSQSEQRTGSFVLPGALAFVVPHAGLAYSGTVAASAYRCARAQKVTRAVILGFSHRRDFPGIWIPDVDAYATARGETAVDREALSALKASPPFQAMPEAPACDHSLEIQLPLLQEALPEARIVPLYVGRLNGSQRALAAGALAALAGPGAVFFASSDLTHYGRDFGYLPFPTDRRAAARLGETDQDVIDAAGSLDPELFSRHLREIGSTACGVAPISLLLEILRLLQQPEEIFQATLDYQTSGEITGDYSHCVSYGALAYFPARAFALDAGEQAVLLDSAQRTLKHLRLEPCVESPSLARRSGVFVTLRQRGELRGCVGYPFASHTLNGAVPELTLKAALEDPRFPALAPGETDVRIEISILSPMKRIADPAALRVNEHGAYLEAGRRRGLLLPHVAEEMRWTGPRFLEGLALKAGVDQRVYDKPATRLSVFRAQVFGARCGNIVQAA
ncbi:MAG: AmmeMemoRadiSam system protein B [Acidobacteria bacterium]|nr:AmmeMemoRadiSam system protein B [Acidobacteriota bacterium]MBI3472456.1 AmmeMemoRadiSam system protein B [Candidatus Solibacter usitatus]